MSGDQKRKRAQIPIVVVESHHHVLEHIHHVLRGRRRPRPAVSGHISRQAPAVRPENWSMLHFDAHADLSCPHDGIPAAACFQPRAHWSSPPSAARTPRAPDEQDDASHDDPGDDNTSCEGKNLYELLDATSTGIAEWILPLVLAAQLTHITWIRPLRPAQEGLETLPRGEHRFQVGAWQEKGLETSPLTPQVVNSFLDLDPTAKVRVDWNCRYYQEDDSYVPHSELLLPHPVHLVVRELTPTGSYVMDAEPGYNMIRGQPWALDICLDYFDCRNPYLTDLEQLDAAWAKSLWNAVQCTTMYREDGSTDPNLFHRHRLLTFRQLLAELLTTLGPAGDQAPDDQLRTALSTYYHSAQEGHQVLQDLGTCLAHSKANQALLTAMAVEAIPHLTMPHIFRDDQVDDGTEMRMSAISTQLQRVRQELDRLPDPPMVITMARSTDDGFTPPAVVEQIQSQVLIMLHERYCGCHRPITSPGVQSEWCCLNLIFDYGPWEGSTWSLK